MFVTFEGLDGSGKSTQAELLKAHLETSGRDVVATREPGGTPAGEAVRELLLNRARGLAPWTEAALFAAARAELVEQVIGPALARGADVVSDRYIDSSLAYQGAARGLGIDEVLELNLRVTGGLLPDRTFLLVLDLNASLARLPAVRDRIEREGGDFLARVDRGYRELAERFPDRIFVIDADGSPNEVAGRVRAKLENLQGFPEQEEAKRLLSASLGKEAAHAFLLHGPRGVGKRRAAFAFATKLLGDDARVARRAHPDLYVVEPLGDQIRIDDVRRLRRDLHMRPFEADRRVYLVLGADELNDDAADALLKDLEEPPPYAVLVLVADDLGPIPETIRSRCQLVPFRRLSERAIREELATRAPGLQEAELTALARAAGGRLDRAERLLDTAAAGRRAALIDVARSVYLDAAFEPAAAAERILDGVREHGAAAKRAAEDEIDGLELPTREGELRVRRAQRGAERQELLATLEELAAWYRDLVAVAAGAAGAAIHYDRLAELQGDGVVERMLGAERASEAVREVWRSLEEFQLNAALALEALFVRLRRELAGSAAA